MSQALTTGETIRLFDSHNNIIISHRLSAEPWTLKIIWRLEKLAVSNSATNGRDVPLLPRLRSGSLHIHLSTALSALYLCLYSIDSLPNAMASRGLATQKTNTGFRLRLYWAAWRSFRLQRRNRQSATNLRPVCDRNAKDVKQSCKSNKGTTRWRPRRDDADCLMEDVRTR